MARWLGPMVLGVMACSGGGRERAKPAPAPVEAPAPPPAPAKADAPNVLILLADDLGTDKVGVYGAHPKAPPTPNIDALAARGVRYTNAYAAPTCSPTRAALMTGRYGRRTGVGSVIYGKRDRKGLPRNEVTLAELVDLAPTPWSTLAIGKWHLGTHKAGDYARDPLVQGFDHHVGALDNLPTTMEDGAEAGYFHWEKTVDGETTWSDAYATTDSVDEALARIPEMGQPWLVHVGFHAVHEPFELPPPALMPTTAPKKPRAAAPRMLAAMTEALDLEIGRLLAGLDPAVRANTVVFFIGDNGTTSDAIQPPWDAERSKKTLFDGGVRVPFIVAGPGVAKPGRASDALVHVVDVFPTVAALAGVDLSAVKTRKGAPVPIDGRSLVPTLRKPSGDTGREHLYNELFRPNHETTYSEKNRRMLRDDRFKLIRTSKGDSFFAYAADRWDEGPDLLAAGALTPEQQQAYERLGAELDRQVASMEAGG